jgi:flagellar basal body-associated protein FliL
VEIEGPSRPGATFEIRICWTTLFDYGERRMKNSKTITIIAVIAIVTATLTIAVNFRSSSVDMSCTGNKETAERIASESGAKLGYVGTYSLENIATTGRDSYLLRN